MLTCFPQIPPNPAPRIPLHRHAQYMVDWIDRHVHVVAPPLLEPPLLLPVGVIRGSQFADPSLHARPVSNRTPILRDGGIISAGVEGGARSSMNAKQLAGALFGAFIVFLGLLWFLQGTGILRVRPILCIGDCTVIVGLSPLWAVSGLIVLIIGAIVVFVSVSSVRTA